MKIWMIFACVLGVAFTAPAQAQTAENIVACSYIHSGSAALSYGGNLTHDLRRASLKDGPDVTMVNEIADQLRQKGKVNHTAFVGVVPGPVNAVALMNGDVYVFTGLVELARYQASQAAIRGEVSWPQADILFRSQVASVLGHEMTHTTRRHHTKNLITQLLAGVGGFMVAKQLGASKQDSVDAAGLSMAVVGAQRSRDLEDQADLVGYESAVAAGFDPRGGPMMMRGLRDETDRFNQRGGSAGAGMSFGGGGYSTATKIGIALALVAPSAFAGHPGTTGRIGRLEQRQARYPRAVTQEPLTEIRTVGAILPTVEIALNGYQSVYFVSGSSGIYPYDDPSAKIVPLATVALTSQKPPFEVVNRAKIDEAIRELRLQQTEFFDQAAVVKIGQWVGAKDILTFTLTDIPTVGFRFGTKTGSFRHRREIAVEAARRKLRLVARITDLTKNVDFWGSGRSGAETGFAINYRDFGIFNGFEVGTAVPPGGEAIRAAIDKIVADLRAFVRPTPEPPVESAASKPNVAIVKLSSSGNGQDAEIPTPVSKPEEISFRLDQGSQAFIGQTWGVYESGRRIATLRVIRIEQERVVCNLVSETQVGTKLKSGMQVHADL